MGTKTMKTFFTGIFLLNLAISAAYGQEESGLERTLRETNTEYSERLVRFADWLDLYIAGERYTPKKNETRAFLLTEITTREREKTFTVINVGGQLRLPNFEERWRIRFDNRLETRERGQAPRYARREEPTDNEDTFGAGLFFGGDLGRLKVDFKPRVLLRERIGIINAIEVFTTIQFEKLSVEPEIEFFADADLGTGVAHALTFSYRITPALTLRQTNDGRYLDRTHEYLTTQTLSLLQRIEDISGVNYTLHGTSSNLPETYELIQWGLGVTYYRNIFKKILDLSVTPHVLYPRDLGFSANPGITLSTIFHI